MLACNLNPFSGIEDIEEGLDELLGCSNNNHARLARSIGNDCDRLQGCHLAYNRLGGGGNYRKPAKCYDENSLIIALELNQKLEFKWV